MNFSGICPIEYSIKSNHLCYFELSRRLRVLQNARLYAEELIWRFDMDEGLDQKCKGRLY